MPDVWDMDMDWKVTICVDEAELWSECDQDVRPTTLDNVPDPL